MASPHYSIVVPLYDEEEVLPEFYERLSAVVDGLAHPAEIIFVDDGSLDRSLTFLRELAASHKGVRVLSLSRNFGHQAAVTAGLAHAAGEAVAVLDADLQDPPELLPELFKRVEEGWDAAYGIRTGRKEGIGKRLAYFVFYRVLRRMANIEIPVDSGDFCAMSRRVLDRLNALPESDRFIRGLRAWLGFRQTGIPYERDRRHAGASKYTVRKLLKLSLDGMLSFSDVPLRLIVLLGVTVSSVSFLGILVVLYRYVFTPYVPGYTSLSVLVVFIGGIQLLTLGVIGEYVGRISRQVKSRPHYVVNERIGFDQG
jgi:polyisoprenyl-phosphate glycosyltransferase